ncbi:MAG: hypothetical protein COT00_04685 [Candidatus Omnitrophica bacterium CG07_land_8_20_14_0_80_50_8]|nr:MAG: hypothetical protein AUJ71_02730 [Candidatus Omnitrophica bacterium CG1_02_49_16]PIU39871.1 MAG: hypothetical protein COT00_04685 [Candidatus Omnitrophica bacterium CG07_land_8_20_14_0_80_50_8]
MFSDPVVGDDFFGRQAILDIILKRANALKSGYRQNVAIIGHQHLGKTSILRHFLHIFRDPEVLCVYVEIKIQALDYFVEQFIRSLLFQFLVQKQVVPTTDSLTGLAETAMPFIPLTVGRIHEIMSLLKQRHAEEAYARLFELTSIVKQETGKHCIVILDEFHRLGEFGVKNTFSNFGKRIMVQKDTMYLLSSSSFSASRRILAEKLSLLFGNFERIYLEPFDFETSFQFLEKKIAPAGIPQNLKYFLVAFTDGQPFFLDTIAKRIRECARLKNETVISRQTVGEVLLKLLFESQGVLNQFFLKIISPWTRSDSRGSHILILAGMANGVNKLKDLSVLIRRNQRDTSRQIEELIEQELIIKTGVFYRFHNKIFKFWMREVYEKKELLLLSSASGPEAFLHRMDDMISEYDELLKMDMTDRVLGLFSQFKNEIVDFGEKKRQLPHFTEFIKSPDDTQTLKGNAKNVIAKGHGRCWVCKIAEEKATEREVMNLVRNDVYDKRGVSTKVLVTLNGADDNAKLLAKEKRVLTLGLSRINMLMDIFGKSPIIRLEQETHRPN